MTENPQTFIINLTVEAENEIYPDEIVKDLKMYYMRYKLDGFTINATDVKPVSCDIKKRAKLREPPSDYIDPDVYPGCDEPPYPD
ncbi:MAG: hypothetical protein WCX79_01165 [Candidatus Paceibacterota bacterium]|jgi:hypothetical protein